MRPAAFLLALALLAGCTSGDGAGPSAAPTSTAGTPASPGATGSAPGTPSGSATASATASPSPAGLPPKAGPPKLKLVGRFENVTHVAAPPGDPRLFVVEQTGRIRLLKNGKPVKAPFLDISGQVRHRGEQGLLSMAFAPDFATSKRFYVDYNGTDGAVRVAEFTVGADPDRADVSSRRELLRIEKPNENHNGGQLVFDADGMLMISIGDGGGGNDPDNNAQDLGTLLGKILRIDPRPSSGKPYGIPRDNPYVSRPGARGEVWAYGLRNPWRFSLDTNGDLYVGDVGQYVIEELSAVAAARHRGANFGWRVYEGRRKNFKNETPRNVGALIEPVHQFNHEGGRCVITAGVVYRGSVTALRDKFLFGEYCTGALWTIPAGTAPDPAVTTLKLTAPQVSTFGTDGFGEVYVASGNGEVWLITA
ncbi:MAG TPA: PQQ-dependent sugar dehydrogenase [Frankiaceae bacterium]|nr:PQQ-dependent sugar dehydrogenase [Frankiaceae bacterium]